MRTIFKWVGFFFISAIIIFFIGPRVQFEEIDRTPIVYDIPLQSLDAYIYDKESEISNIKPGNEAKIIWADSIKKTEYAVVYLHGFSASHEEGAPLHSQFAARYGANLYLARLYDHGIESDDTFKGLLPEDLVNSAKEAIAIGRLIGDKVILITCSTGGTLGAILAPYDESIHSMFMYSPNIDLYDSSSDIIVGPWGRQLLKLVMGGEYNRISYSETAKKFWNPCYHIDGIVALKWLIDREMNVKTFSKIDIPIYLGYYYKSEELQDNVVSVPRMLDFYDQINTPSGSKRKEAFPNAGRHVISSYVFSEDLDHIIERSYDFAEEILGLSPIIK